MALRLLQVAAGYQGVTVTLRDNKSLGSTASSITQMQMVNNVNVRTLKDNIPKISTANTELCQPLLATQ